MQCTKTLFSQAVEVLGRYSNHCDQGTRIDRVLEIPLSEPTTHISKPQRQVHRRLQAGELDELAEAYLGGATLSELSDRFRRHRTTISTELERRGVARRYRMVEGERLQQAIQGYQDGKSLASIGDELGIAGDTVRKALAKAGVKLRPRRGWKYRSWAARSYSQSQGQSLVVRRGFDLGGLASGPNWRQHARSGRTGPAISQTDR